MAQCYKHGLVVSKPFGDNAPYDFITGSGKILKRVQVKSTAFLDEKRNAYSVVAGKGSRSKTPYSSEDVDIIAIHIVPLDVWYIIPVDVLDGHVKVHISPHRKGEGRFEYYLDAWRFLEK